MQTVIVVVASASIAFLPVFVNTNFVVDFKTKKIYFTVSIFGLIDVLGGYMTVEDLNVFIHVSEKKALVFDAEKFIISKPKLFDFKAVELLSYRSLYKTDINCTDVALSVCCALFAINNTLSPLIHHKKPFITIKNDILISETCQTAYFGSATLMFNIFGVSVLLIKKIIEKGIYAKSKEQHRKSR